VSAEADTLVVIILERRLGLLHDPVSRVSKPKPKPEQTLDVRRDRVS
jgi:hypothetical protein